MLLVCRPFSKVRGTVDFVVVVVAAAVASVASVAAVAAVAAVSVVCVVCGCCGCCCCCCCCCGCVVAVLLLYCCCIVVVLSLYCCCILDLLPCILVVLLLFWVSNNFIGKLFFQIIFTITLKLHETSAPACPVLLVYKSMHLNATDTAMLHPLVLVACSLAPLPNASRSLN